LKKKKIIFLKEKDQKEIEKKIRIILERKLKEDFLIML